MEEFDVGLIEQIAYVLEGCCTHQELTRVFEQCRFDIETQLGLSKPKRIATVLSHEQRKVESANCVLRFIKECLSKSRFVNNPEGFEEKRCALNRLLVLVGLSYGKDCQFSKVEPAKTIDEVQQRVNSVLGKLRERGAHPEVLRYCTREFLAEDYFHGIFEACKGVMERLRDLSGLRTDGAELIQEAFSSKRPLIAFNQLQSESEISEHKGISSLMLGCCQFLRNPRAHAPRILWHDETNVLEAMTFISMLHRVLDKCVKVPNGYCAADQNPTA